MPRKRIHKFGTFTFRGPYELASAIGDFADPEARRALKIVAYDLSAAGAEVEAAFSPEEWRLLARALETRFDPSELSPDDPHAAATLGSFVAQGLVRLGGVARADRDALAGRVSELTRHQAWAVYVACEFVARHGDEVGEGAAFWDRSVRQETLSRVKGWGAEGEE